MIIIGITGTIGAGKGTIVDYLLNKKGFTHFSVRDFLTEEIARRGLALNRDSMVTVANDLRTTHGSSYITDQLYKRASQSGQNCIIESIRAVGEIESLRKCGQFFLFAVDADVKKRYDRILLRGSSTDHIDFETFKANEQREMESSDPSKQNLSACISMADFVFNNDGSIEDLTSEVEKVIAKLT